MLIDSGAQDNLIDEHTFEKWTYKPKLNKPSTRLYAYNSNKEIPTIGEFQTNVMVGEKQYEAIFRIVQGKSGNLLSFSTAKQLDLFSEDQFRPKDTIRKCNNIESNRYNQIMDQFKDVFNEEIGKLKGFKVKLHIDTSIKPVQQPYRRVPYNLAQATEDEIDQLIKSDVIEEAKGPTGWVSQMVVVPKEKKPGKVRITTDMRVANKAIIREKFPIPTVEEIA